MVNLNEKFEREQRERKEALENAKKQGICPYCKTKVAEENWHGHVEDMNCPNVEWNCDYE